MPYNYRKLAGKIKEKFGGQKEFSRAVGLSEHSVSAKMNNKVGWKQQEITKSCRVLGLEKNQIPEYFFTEGGEEDGTDL